MMEIDTIKTSTMTDHRPRKGTFVIAMTSKRMIE